MSNEKAKEALRHILDGFQRRDDPGDLWVEGSTGIPVDRDEIPVPGIVLLLLTEVMGMVNHGIHEKTAWYVPVGFQGTAPRSPWRSSGCASTSFPPRAATSAPKRLAKKSSGACTRPRASSSGPCSVTTPTRRSRTAA